MPRPGIPPALEQAVLDESAKGRSQRDIAAWLKATHGVGVAHVTVGKLLKRVAEERAPAVRAAVAEKAGKSVGRDLELLQELQDELDEKRKALAKDDTRLRDYLFVVDRLHGVTVSKLKAAGVGGGEAVATLGDLLALAFESK